MDAHLDMDRIIQEALAEQNNKQQTIESRNRHISMDERNPDLEEVARGQVESLLRYSIERAAEKSLADAEDDANALYHLHQHRIQGQKKKKKKKKRTISY